MASSEPKAETSAWMPQIGPKSRRTCFCSAAATDVSSSSATALPSETSATWIGNILVPPDLNGTERLAPYTNRAPGAAFASNRIVARLAGDGDPAQLSEGVDAGL